MSDTLKTMRAAMDKIRRQSYGPPQPYPIHPDDAARYIEAGMLQPHPTKAGHWIGAGAWAGVVYVGTSPIPLLERIEDIGKRIQHLRQRGRPTESADPV